MDVYVKKILKIKKLLKNFLKIVDYVYVCIYFYFVC